MDRVSDISAVVKLAASEAGFELAGIAAVGEADFPELARFPAWVEEGRAGEMEYMKTRDEQGRLKRASLKHAAPWARSVVVCAIRYDTPHPLSTECDEAGRGWISRYAWSQQDYHDSVMEKLRRVEARLGTEAVNDPQSPLQTRCYVDTGPLMERVYAKHAGVGWIGKNTCIINQQRGSFIFLGVILTSLDLAPDLPAADRCGSCTRCIDACPTDALVAPGELDSRRCIAYLTIEKRGAIDEELRAGMGRHVFGCDICQDVCPWNQKARRTHPPLATEEVSEELVGPALEWLAELSEEEFRNTFRGSPIKRAKYAGWRRNAAIAMGNSGDRSFLPKLSEWASDGDANVAEHARWAAQRIRFAQELTTKDTKEHGKDQMPEPANVPRVGAK
jgi:epoxyqueuosine reductase